MTIESSGNAFDMLTRPSIFSKDQSFTVSRSKMGPMDLKDVKIFTGYVDATNKSVKTRVRDRRVKTAVSE